MKKRILAVLLATAMVLSLIGCGGSDTPSAASDPAPASSPAAGAPAVSEPAQSEPEAPASEYYFADNVLVSADVRIEITDYKVIQPGDTGNEYGEKPVIAFWYNTTNLSGNENVDPMSAWIAMFTCIQDNNPNAVNELTVAGLPDDAFLESQMEVIKKGGTVANAMAYELDDLTTPVMLKATRGIGGEDLGEQTFEIA